MKQSFKPLLLFICLLTGQLSSAQEILLNLIIDDQLYPYADKSIFVDIKTEVEDLVNNRSWTEDEFEENERINLSIFLTVDKGTGQNDISCSAQIQSTRPVYNSAYESAVFNFIDTDFSFKYAPGDNLDFNENTYQSELTTLLGFYCYIALGMDYDTFEDQSGNDYYALANQVMNNHPNPTNTGWDSDRSSNITNNRFSLIDNILNPQFTSFRTALYDYHRLGLDLITTTKTEAIQKITTALETIKEIKDLNPSSILISSFMLGKRNEIISILKGADSATQDKAIKTLRILDPGNAEKYMAIKE